jgi:hypothetical protein
VIEPNAPIIVLLFEEDAMTLLMIIGTMTIIGLLTAKGSRSI